MKEYRTGDGQVFPSFVDALIAIKDDPNAAITGPEWTVTREGTNWFQIWPDKRRDDQTKRITALLKYYAK